MESFKEIERKWQKKWLESKIFYSDRNDKPKYFLTTPYPYVSGLLHLGHAVTSLHPDVIARYKRMRGYNVLWSFGFHATGSPISTAAQKVKDRDEKQINALKLMLGDLSEEELKKFEDDTYWVKFFSEEDKKDLYAYGLSLDPRRHFITTELNPPYARFVEWQMRKLKEKGYIVRGNYPVVWCPHCKVAIGDHARAEGEGETVQEFTLLKFKFTYHSKPVFLVAATLRPETVYGQTNFWINPSLHYVLIRVKYSQNNKDYDEHWILSRRAADRLKDQGKDVTILEDVDPEELIGKTCLAPKVHRDIPILPAEFVEENFGTGLVTSVPSDAPHDYIALIELQKDANLRRKLHVPEEVVKDIKPIPIIDSEEYGDMPAVKICKELNITSQNDPDLELAKKKVYSIGFHTGVLKDTCGKYAGMPVEKAKELMKEEMIEEGEATTFYELTGKVVCRCGTEAIPKLVNDQWFMDYSNPEWKKKVHEAIDSMTFVPEIVRKQFHHTVDWLKKWPCTREHGLGEHLPWDKKWLVESLSDSTIYMAYYILAKYLQHPRDYGLTQEIVNNLNDDFFDYVLLGKGSAKKVESSCHVPEDLVEEIRKDFLYYYPHDYRNSGKDLIQNHLTFSIFHHVAIFPKEFWPKLYDINGFVKLQGQKMSKSKGNFKTLRQLLEKFGADITRVASLYAGEGLDDPKFEYNFFDSAKQKLTNIFLLLNEKGTSEEYDWPEELFESRINELIKDVTEALDSFKYRTYIQKLIFEYYSIFQEYKKIVSKMGRGMNKALVHKYLSAYYRMLQPATPHLAEEAWHLLGNDTFVSLEKWPEYDESKIKEDAKFIVNIATTIVDDVRTIQRLVKINKIKRITLVTAPLKKYEMLKDIKELVDEGKEYSEIVKTIMSKYRDNSVKLDKLMKNIPSSILDESKERDALTKIIPLLKKEFNCEVIVMHSEDSKGMPGKPAIFIE